MHLSVVTADEWGSIGGKILVEGEIPERIVLIAKDAEIKDKEVCSTEEHLAEDLMIDKDSRGLANVFVYLAKKPKSIHPDFASRRAQFSDLARAIRRHQQEVQGFRHCR